LSSAEVLLDAKLYVTLVADHIWHSTEMLLIPTEEEPLGSTSTNRQA